MFNNPEKLELSPFPLKKRCCQVQTSVASQYGKEAKTQNPDLPDPRIYPFPLSVRSYSQEIRTEHTLNLGQAARPWGTALDREGTCAQPSEPSGPPGQPKRQRAITNNKSKCSSRCPPWAVTAHRGLHLPDSWRPLLAHHRARGIMAHCPLCPPTGKPSHALPWRLPTALLGTQQATTQACQQPTPRPKALIWKVSRFLLL